MFQLDAWSWASMHQCYFQGLSLYFWPQNCPLLIMSILLSAAFIGISLYWCWLKFPNSLYFLYAQFTLNNLLHSKRCWMCLNTQVMWNWIREEEKYSLKTERWRKQRLLFFAVRGNCQCHIPFPLGNESRRPCRMTQMEECCRVRTTRSSETKTWHIPKYSQSERALCNLPYKKQN